ncbi:hypothetical protein COO60DRAFT_419820 [Scenedesmus sp. NREL 46B-D3]|nr:hypothetical protein COO60DRAFT_419820 [Scenedesmus sp. NREL 46B-D3]
MGTSLCSSSCCRTSTLTSFCDMHQFQQRTKYMRPSGFRNWALSAAASATPLLQNQCIFYSASGAVLATNPQAHQTPQHASCLDHTHCTCVFRVWRSGILYCSICSSSGCRISTTPGPQHATPLPQTHTARFNFRHCTLYCTSTAALAAPTGHTPNPTTRKNPHHTQQQVQRFCSGAFIAAPAAPPAAASVAHQFLQLATAPDHDA